MKTKYIFFRNNGLPPTVLAKYWLYNKELNLNWPQLTDRNVFYTYLGRISNALVCLLLNIRQGDELLAPSYNCGSEIDPFLSFGMNAVMYRVDHRLNIDIDDLSRRITPRTRIVYVTHYFGWPQPLQEIKQLCKEYNLFLMEDCALSLFSHSAQGPIGQEGDAAIFSFRKSLPVLDGAALTLRAGIQPSSLPDKRPALRTTARETVPYLARWLLHSMDKSALFSNILSAAKNNIGNHNAGEFSADDLDMPQDYYFSEHIMPLTISRVSAGILSCTDPDAVFSARRRNYQRLYEAIAELNTLMPLLGPLPDGVCPLLMPLVVEDVFEWMRELNRFGVKAIRWWEGFNRKLEWQEFPEAKQLKKELLVLPVHQFLSDADIDYMISCIRHTSKKMSSTYFIPWVKKPINMPSVL